MRKLHHIIISVLGLGLLGLSCLEIYATRDYPKRVHDAQEYMSKFERAVLHVRV